MDISSRAFWSVDTALRDAAFAALRRDRPVSWHKTAEETVPWLAGTEGFWAVARHRDILAVSRMPYAFRGMDDDLIWEDFPAGVAAIAPSLLVMDPARRSRAGQLVRSVFTPRRVARLEQQIRNQANRLVDGLASVAEADFVAAVSSQLPLRTVGEMFGLPIDDRGDVMDATNAVISWYENGSAAEPERLDDLLRGISTLAAHAHSLIDRRRTSPGDDLVTALMSAEIRGHRLTDEEIAAYFLRACVAQSTVTRQTASHAIKALCEAPAHRALLMADFENRISPAIEEFLRWATPVMAAPRRAVADVELAGQQISAGDVVVMLYASGNRDEEVFPAPNRFDVTRWPNRHVSFGGGRARLGDHLVRTQLQAVFTELLYRLPDLRVGEPEYGTGGIINAITRLPCIFTPVGMPMGRTTVVPLPGPRQDLGIERVM